MGNIVVLPWANAGDLPGLWLSLLGIITQEGRRPLIIYYYTWNYLNASVLRQSPAEAMQFTHSLLKLLCTILHSNPQGGPNFVSKIDLSDTYMRV